jgi:hypothetical protein
MPTAARNGAAMRQNLEIKEPLQAVCAGRSCGHDRILLASRHRLAGPCLLAQITVHAKFSTIPLKIAVLFSTGRAIGPLSAHEEVAR